MTVLCDSVEEVNRRHVTPQIVDRHNYNYICDPIIFIILTINALFLLLPLLLLHACEEPKNSVFKVEIRNSATT